MHCKLILLGKIGLCWQIMTTYKFYWVIMSLF